ncbi:bifunctional Mechanosensitive ion channel MscS/Mechanosensitive ion channel MscS-like [Babesia duncani]|uniref:Bifunctional Mechanosensitive ion channel MscS/Mechanosensitive ion channel MscS-like n=1 Tax=Babesia duncani TaxID=323732 RepID=A0AAD9UQJ0_9APIC|nr:bifunctional Mechanosensitive ion channel MscS/Mechanosensitive ion channel MscS-like [Babesia duncani]
MTDDESVKTEIDDKIIANETVYTPDVYDEDEDEAESLSRCNFLLVGYRTLFPDNQPIIWIGIHLLIILAYLISTETENWNAVPFFYILGINLIIYVGIMVSRFIMVNCVLVTAFAKHPRAFALLNMLDPCAFYVAWACGISFLWQILIQRSPDNSQDLIINSFFGPWDSIATFRIEDLNWIACSVYVYVILSLRCLMLSVVSFIFELNLLKSSNKELKRYLKIYANMRRFNMDWLHCVLSNPQLLDSIHNSSVAHPQFTHRIFTFIDMKYRRVYSIPKNTSLRLLAKGKWDRHRSNDPKANEFPKELLDNIIEESSTSGFSNWLLIYYVTKTPPTISLLHQDISLADTERLDEVIEQLFWQIYMTTAATLEQKYESPKLPEERKNNAKQVTFSIPNLFENSSVTIPSTIPSTSKAVVVSLANASKVSKHISREVAMSTLCKLRSDIAHNFGRASDGFSFSAPIADFHFGQDPHTSDIYLDRERISSFVRDDRLDDVMSWLDLSGHDRINLHMFQQAIRNIFNSRKKFKHNIKGQENIFSVLQRLLAVGSWLLALVFLALAAGMTAEAIVVSGAALLSAFTVALSYLYTNFIMSVIFVAFSNPYNVGDRVRVNGGEPLIVKRIHTYTTEFATIVGKIMIYQNASLSTMHITNESRSTSATLEIPFSVDFETTPEHIAKLEQQLAETVNARPNDFVKDSVWLAIYAVNPGHCFKLAIWVACVENWSNWQRIFQLKTELLELLIRLCKINSITYKLPMQPVCFTEALQDSGSGLPH